MKKKTDAISKFEERGMQQDSDSGALSYYIYTLGLYYIKGTQLDGGEATGQTHARSRWRRPMLLLVAAATAARRNRKLRLIKTGHSNSSRSSGTKTNSAYIYGIYRWNENEDIDRESGPRPCPADTTSTTLYIILCRHIFMSSIPVFIEVQFLLYQIAVLLFFFSI